MDILLLIALIWGYNNQPKDVDPIAPVGTTFNQAAGFECQSNCTPATQPVSIESVETSTGTTTTTATVAQIIAELEAITATTTVTATTTATGTGTSTSTSTGT
jgi:hypothetical protein